MKLHEKIRKIRKEKGLTMRQLEARLREVFADKALRYNTLYRIEKGLRDARISSLTQICAGLGVTLRDLKEGTDAEPSTDIDLIRKREKYAQYVYSEKAAAQILTKERQPFLGIRLSLQPSGKTPLEQDPEEKGVFQKWVYGLRGKFVCVVGKDRFVISKDEAVCFSSSIPHYFENPYPRPARCIIIQNPKHV
jgi:transcriptional regulator with XRE-family HTH domain